jgi:hypothetical protein
MLTYSIIHNLEPYRFPKWIPATDQLLHDFDDLREASAALSQTFDLVFQVDV